MQIHSVTYRKQQRTERLQLQKWLEDLTHHERRSERDVRTNVLHPHPSHLKPTQTKTSHCTEQIYLLMELLMNRLIIPLLRSHHWLPVSARVQFKTQILAYKAQNGLESGYLV